MNKIAITSVLAVMTGLAGAPQTAQARGDEALAAIGGFIGGVLIASAAHDHHAAQYAYCEFDGCGNRYVVAHRHGQDYYGRDYYGRDRRDWITVRVWVPGHWTIRIGDHGHRARYYERGRYEFRRQLVIVDSRHDRGYGRGR